MFGSETACPDAYKFETFILLLRLVFELVLLKPPIGISVFGSETRITRPIAPKICTKNNSYVPHLCSKFQVSTFSRFKVIAFSASSCRIRNFARKKTYELPTQSVAEVPKIYESPRHSAMHNCFASRWLRLS